MTRQFYEGKDIEIILNRVKQQLQLQQQQQQQYLNVFVAVIVQNLINTGLIIKIRLFS